MNNNKFFEDFAKLAGSALDTAYGSVAEVKQHYEDWVQEKIKSHIKEANLVTREEFIIVEKMAQKSREENERLKKEVEKLQQKLKNK